jgi:hypothetical protein
MVDEITTVVFNCGNWNFSISKIIMQFLSLHFSKKFRIYCNWPVRMINYRGLQYEILLILTFIIHVVPYRLPLFKMPATGMPLVQFVNKLPWAKI